ncbi:glutamate racemase [Gluconobacter kanchanaburiensis]|uniref:Glutamate racemase n=1 Tax=Gluconobacter kanchanaburiensis NBRC 103587 TaxID=1307948 RepID=A0A511B6R8_9PROT|nr:glutamate racemase [Gluconobacter kanchanaburiensis]MBF0860615.1 glutamate racemase [Gluconobacter kanchanaburiensis]GBR69473.1 glutamate racemase [Gluconobacter kanchanaburiensis NBRC 103587]GEK96126.1 glutamate racemase [Gluconobacter kanchanaburiensis NBRC 103587]
MKTGASVPGYRGLVFDSGIGGMGVVQALRDLLPALHIDYLADTALFPYGEQPDDALTSRIVSLLSEACDRLKPDVLVIACNTASTIALPALRQKLSIPVVGCVPPIRWAGRVSTSRVIGLLSTSATARRPYILQLHEDFASDCRLVTHGARRLADLAERAFLGENIPDADIRHELDCLFSQPYGDEIDTVGLGCTHYTFLMDAFERLSPAAITWLDPAPAVARQIRTVLQTADWPARTPHSGRLLVTSAPPEAQKLLTAAERLGFAEWELFGNAALQKIEP